MFYFFYYWQCSTVYVFSGLILVTDLKVWCLQMKAALPNELLRPAALGVLQLLHCLFPLFSSWVIATAPVMRGKCIRRYMNQRSTLCNVLLRTFWRYSVGAFLFPPSFPPDKPWAVCFSIAITSRFWIKKKIIKQPVSLSFLTEIPRGNKRQSHFGIPCSLTARHFMVFPENVFGRFSLSSSGDCCCLPCSSLGWVVPGREQLCLVHGAPTGASSKLWRLVASLPHALCLGEVLDMRQHLPGHCCVSSQPISLPRLLDYPCSQSEMISMTAD